MPPNHFALCPHCKRENVFDEAELLATRPGARTVRPQQHEPKLHEFAVTCQHCHRPFKIRIPLAGGG